NRPRGGPKHQHRAVPPEGQRAAARLPRDVRPSLTPSTTPFCRIRFGEKSHEFRQRRKYDARLSPLRSFRRDWERACAAEKVGAPRSTPALPNSGLQLPAAITVALCRLGKHVCRDAFVPGNALLIVLLAYVRVLAWLRDEGAGGGELAAIGRVIRADLHAVVWSDQRPARVPEPRWEIILAGELREDVGRNDLRLAIGGEGRFRHLRRDRRI